VTFGLRPDSSHRSCFLPRVPSNQRSPLPPPPPFVSLYLSISVHVPLFLPPLKIEL
jgi:hypothetical protein